jgi:hypothetical protein
MYSMVTVGTKEKGQFKTSDHLKIDRLGLSVPVHVILLMEVNVWDNTAVAL